MKARESHPCFFLSTNPCRSGFIPPALRARKPVTKAPTTKGARSKEPGAERQSQNQNKMRLSKPMNRKPSPRPRPRLSTVCPALALPGLPLPRRLRFARLCPSRLRFAPSSPGLRLSCVPLSPFLSRSVGSFLRRSPPSAGRGFPRCRCVPVFPRSAGRVFPVLGGVGLPSFSRGRGRGLGFRACVRCRVCCAFRGASVPLDTIRNNSNIFNG